MGLVFDLKHRLFAFWVSLNVHFIYIYFLYWNSQLENLFLSDTLLMVFHNFINSINIARNTYFVCKLQLEIVVPTNWNCRRATLNRNEMREQMIRIREQFKPFNMRVVVAMRRQLERH